MNALELMRRMRRCQSGVTAAFLRRAMGVDVQHVLRVLVDLGMVERHRSEDGRRYVYALSVSGLAWLDEQGASL